MKNTTFKRLARNATLGASVLLLDTAAHAAINVSTQATQNMSCSGGVCTATAQKAYLNVNDVTTMLAGGDLKIATAAGAQDIHIQAPFSWTSTSRLTLDAQRSIEFEKPVSVAGTGALTLITNDGGTGGDYWFDEGASVSFWDTSSSLVINGQSFTLVKDIKTLASDIKKAPKGDYALANSYDASADGMYNHAPILTVFGGIFEGLGNAISNMYIRKDAIAKDLNVGLFGGLGPGGIIRDITLFDAGVDVAASNANVGTLLGYSNGGYVLYAVANGGHAGSSAFANVSGGLIGSIDPSSLLWKCSSSSVSAGRIAGSLVGLSQGAIEYSSASGNASSTYAAGSLVGMSEGSIDSSSASGNAGGGGLAGGLVGESDGDVSNSYATGEVDAGPSTYGGGLVGLAKGKITSSHATGAVKDVYSTPATLGGLVGGAFGSIVDSYATGEVAGLDEMVVGGLVGRLYNDRNSAMGAIRHAYALGSVSGGYRSQIGGLVGEKDKDAPIDQAYSTGALPSGFKAHIGGLIGYDGTTHHPKNNISNAYWDFDTSGVTNPSQGAGNIPNDSGITGLTDAQLKSNLPAGFDRNIWGQDKRINNGYPYLLANPPPKGNKAAKISHKRIGRSQ